MKEYKMKKHPVFITLLITVIIVGAGISVAYYNTKSFGFDEDAVLFSKNDESITVLDYKIYYKDLEHVYKESRKYMPEEAYSTSPYIVERFEAMSNIMYI